MPTAGAGATPLDGRLGGTKQSFETKFGHAVASPTRDATVAVYDVAGGLVAVAYHRNRATEITLSADQAGHTPPTEPDPHHWTVSAATDRVKQFLPADTTCPEAPLTDPGRMVSRCHSAALAAVIGRKTLDKLGVTGKPGDLRSTLSLDTAGNVFAIDLRAGDGPKAGARSGSPAATPATDASTGGTGVGSEGVKHCSDFATHDEAQAYFDAHGGDANPVVSRMDRDHDGKACESLP